MLNDELYVVSANVLPEIFAKVLEVKSLIHTGVAKDISDGVKMVGISRSAYYKYKDHVFLLTLEIFYQYHPILPLQLPLPH